MKLKLIYIILLIIVSCTPKSAVENDTDKPGIPTLSVEEFTNGEELVLKWTRVTDADLSLYELSERNATIGGRDTVVVKISGKETSYVLKSRKGRNFFDNKYVYKLRAVDRTGNESAYSNEVSTTVIGRGEKDLADAWKLFSAKNPNISEALKIFEGLVKMHSPSSKKAFEGLGWVYIVKADGMDTTFLKTADSYLGNSFSLDAQAGKAVISLLLGDFKRTAEITDAIKADKLRKYVHTYLKFVNYRYILTQGAFAYWLLDEVDEVNAYLDELLPKDVPHKLSRSEQLIKLSSLVGTLPPPIVEKNLKDLHEDQEK